VIGSCATMESGCSSSSPTKNGPRGVFLFLAAFSLALCLWNLGGRSFENKEYRRYAEIAWEIVARGDWILLHHQNEIYVDKPPLHFWKIALCYYAFGVGPFSARLPAALFAVGGVLLAAFLARRLTRDDETALLSGMLLLCSYGWFWWARRTRIDMEFAVLFSAAQIAAFAGTTARSAAGAGLLYAVYWFVTGLAFLDKGPVAFTCLLPVAVYFVLLLRRGELPRGHVLLFLLGLPWALLAVTPWALALGCHSGFEQYWEAFCAKKIMSRHEGPFYYLLEFPMKFFPASLILAVGLWFLRRAPASGLKIRSMTFPALWFLLYTGILHLTSVKNHRYLLPAFIPCSVFAAWVWLRASRARVGRLAAIERIWDRVLLAGACAGLAVPLGMALWLDTGLGRVVVPVALLGLLLYAGRRAIPFGSAAWCINFAVILGVIEAADTARDPVTSPVLRLYRTAEKRGLGPEDVFFARGAEPAKSLFELYSGKRWPATEPLRKLLKERPEAWIVAPDDPESLRLLKQYGRRIEKLKHNVVAFPP